MNSARKPLSEEAKNEIERFDREVKMLASGQRDMDDFKKFRLNNGVYGIRFSENHMIRIKIPYGVMTADQFETVALIAEKFTPTQLSHVTTRQAIQLHNIKRPDLAEVVRLVNECGLTSREACGNTVRNISCDPLAGIAEDELFDPRPYADLVFRYMLRNPVGQNLPRKWKISSEGSPTSDRARTLIHDIGFRAVVREVNGVQQKGFETTIGGGLGAFPFVAQLLEEFTPVDQILQTVEAAVRIFDRHGDRRDKNRARIKFVVAKWGIEEFRKVFLEERRAVAATVSGRFEKFKLEWTEETAPQSTGKILTSGIQPGYDEWAATNVVRQKQKGFSAVYVRCYLGDVDPTQAREIAAISREFGAGRMRTTITQNLLLCWIPDAALPTVYARLLKIGMALPQAQRIADITRCPGADTCNLAITHSKGLAHDITQKVFSNGYANDPAFKDITIKISGCMNSCGQHHIADIGFYGASKNLEGKSVPHYQMLLGGRTGLKTADAKYGERVALVPARRVQETVKLLLDLYKSEKQAGEDFARWTDRKGAAFFKEKIAPFQDMEGLKGDPKNFEDLGDEGIAFKVAVGKGECAA